MAAKAGACVWYGLGDKMTDGARIGRAAARAGPPEAHLPPPNG